MTVGQVYSPTETANSGEVNACGGDAFVKNIGGTTKVKICVQGQPLALSTSDDFQMAGGITVFVPKLVKNPTFTLVSTSTPEADKSNPSMSTPRPVAMLNLPTKVATASNAVSPDWLKIAPGRGKHIVSSTPLIEKVVVANSPDLAPIRYPNIGDYDVYSLPVTQFDTIMTVDVEGDLTVTEKDMYVPVRVVEARWHCLQGVCEPLLGYPNLNTEMLPPAHEGLPQSEKDYMASMHSADGLVGYGQCRVTRDGTNGGHLDLILEDVFPAGTTATDKLVQTFIFYLNPAVKHYVAGFGFVEDGCDTAAFHVTICEAALVETPPPTPEKIPEVIVSTVKETVTPEKVTETVTVPRNQ